LAGPGGAFLELRAEAEDVLAGQQGDLVMRSGKIWEDLEGEEVGNGGKLKLLFYLVFIFWSQNCI